MLSLPRVVVKLLSLKTHDHYFDTAYCCREKSWLRKGLNPHRGRNRRGQAHPALFTAILAIGRCCYKGYISKPTSLVPYSVFGVESLAM